MPTLECSQHRSHHVTRSPCTQANPVHTNTGRGSVDTCSTCGLSWVPFFGCGLHHKPRSLPVSLGRFLSTSPSFCTKEGITHRSCPAAPGPVRLLRSCSIFLQRPGLQPPSVLLLRLWCYKFVACRLSVPPAVFLGLRTRLHRTILPTNANCSGRKGVAQEQGSGWFWADGSRKESLGALGGFYALLVEVARCMAGRGAGAVGGWQASQPPAYLTLSLLLCYCCCSFVLSVLSVGPGGLMMPPIYARVSTQSKHPQKSGLMRNKHHHFITAIIKFSLTTESAMKKIGDSNTRCSSWLSRPTSTKTKYAVKKLHDIDTTEVNTLIRPVGEKKAHARLTPD
ncbi:60S ribosomal protein L23a [Galemys pyrenaicus]|uniref:60S ribosomal protein L23a n=1 Tax=Galemys pyrenaicus TaxID=202257 RepID=A0A8J5ZYT0_GALPY|nr:60S ribosomal protein L23a [Galemys pyrenaicus]